ncbi:MAG: hypothetical protein ACE5GD_05955 [Candidatus Geothermarchaeales archaeon]
MQLQIEIIQSLLFPLLFLLVILGPFIKKKLVERKIVREKRQLRRFITSILRVEGSVSYDYLAGAGLPEAPTASVIQELIESGLLISRRDDGAITYSLSESEKITWDDYVMKGGIQGITVDSVNQAKSITHDIIKYCQSNGIPVKHALMPRMIQFFISPMRYGQSPPFTLGWIDGSPTISVFIRDPNTDPSKDSCPGWKWNDSGMYWYLKTEKPDFDVEGIGPVLKRAYELASSKRAKSFSMWSKGGSASKS